MEQEIYVGVELWKCGPLSPHAFECSTGWFCNKIINAGKNSAPKILVLVHNFIVYGQETRRNREKVAIKTMFMRIMS